MSATPAWASLPVTGMVRIDTANTGLDGSGTLGTLYTGDSTGTVVARIRIVAAEATTAGMIRFFLYDGTNTRLIWERRVTAITPASTVKAFEDEFELSDFGLKDNTWVLKCATHNAEDFNVFMYGGKL